MSTQAIATAKEVFDLLRDDLLAIEKELVRDSVSNVSAITEISDYLREAGGKRIRPSLLLLAARSLDYRGRGATRLGAVVEMVHTATLVHDDIIDAADTRRGRPSANTTWGNSKCVLAGDWLYMQAFRVALEERNLRVLDLLISLTQQMVEGELLQMEKIGRMVNEAEYYDLIYRKTACLFHVSMRLGGVLAGASVKRWKTSWASSDATWASPSRSSMTLLDLTASEEVLGKPVASDLREGKATLAVIHAYERATPAERRSIDYVLEDEALTRTTHEEIVRILHRYGSVDYAMNTAFGYAELARKAMADLPETEAKRALLWMPDFVVAREK